MGKLYNIFKATKLGKGTAADYYTTLIAQSLSKGSAKEYELSAVPPLIFDSNGQAITAWTIWGNKAQNGTPTPQNPVDVLGVGEKETSGSHAGKYKISIISAGQTMSVYISEMQTVRNIKKLVLDGTETGWTKSGTYQGSFFAQVLTNINITANTEPVQYALCSHAQVVKLANFANGTATLTGNTTTKSINLWIGESEWTVDEFKSYLATQYAAGTPVTIWYVLAEPTTAIVNEPLMKIGEYADSISNAASIPTVKGNNTLSVDTDVQPSQMYIKYYK